LAPSRNFAASLIVQIQPGDIACASLEFWKWRSRMNWDQIEGNWKQFTGKVKSQWGKLTDDDIDRINGNREQLEGRIQEAYGKSREEAQREVDDFLSRQ
jgi:uncharacterized protein YjbJ (UPF0337 family)